MINIQNKANNPAYAVHCLLQGFKWVADKRLRKYVLVPIGINLILYSIVLGLGYIYILDLIEQFIPSWLSWLEWLIWPLFFLSFSAIGFFTFTLVANLMASPFYSQLAAKTIDLVSDSSNEAEHQKTNQVILAEINRIGYLISRMIPLLILFVIPVVNLVAPFLWMLFGAWSMSLEFMAYPLENKGILFKQQREMAKTRRLGLLSFGGLVFVGLSIPLLNLIISPVAVIAATLYIRGTLDDNELTL